MEAKELYDICERLVSHDSSPEVSRHQLHEILSLTAAKGCSSERGAFGNLFSQIDFLCRRLGISDEERQEIQTARRNTSSSVIGDLQSPSPSEWLYDVRAVSLFISAVFHEDVSGSLRCLLPSAPRLREKGLKINKRYVRCIVHHHDDSTIWADTDEGTITIDYGTTEQGRDFSYLRKILRPGMQLNLLDCHVASSTASMVNGQCSMVNGQWSMGMVTPTIIIVEPDFLIDISSLATCFTSYGHHPLLYTLNRLKPRVNNQAALLGNFAGVALDLLVHSSEPHPQPLPCEGRGGDDVQPCEERGEVQRAHERCTLSAALKRAFREDILRYLACPDFDPVKFKRDAQRQMTNIAEAVDILQAEAQGHGGFLLEPSFVCEQLGLQGRVDLMTTDMSLLVEQKSGKNMKIEYQSHDSHGLQLEAHYVQLLLYYATLRYNFQRGDREVDTRLLYSRYEASRGLLAVNYYRTLLREALKLRNQIVATELLIARDGFSRILPLLNADTIYKDVPRDGYFHRYVLPELSTLNAQLSTLNSIERLYVERMMTFVYREQVAARLGSSEQRLHHSSGAASDLWLMPLDEKLETGNIYLGLTIAETQRTAPDGGYDLITLCSFSCDTASTHLTGVSNFRRGDMVYIYQYDGQPDVRRAILYKGTLSNIADGCLTVILTDGQQNAAVFNNDRPWAIEHGGSDAGTAGNIRSLFQFATADPSRRALLLGQREPQADTSIQLSQSYNPHYDDILQRIGQARDYFLLVGPPGTGKTSMALRFMVQEELAGWQGGLPLHQITNTHHPSLLLTAYTNRAVDEICDMLETAGFEYLRLGNAASCDPRFRNRLLGSVCCDSVATTPTLDGQQILLERTPIIVSTTSMLLARPFIFDIKHFSLAIVDEASQILEPGLVGLLASDCIDRFVLIGDHKQLPAVVQQGEQDSVVSEPQLRAIGLTDCRQSLFQRLYQWELSQGRSQFIGTLTHQGRMHPEVALFPSQQFYDGHLLPVPVAHQKATSLDYDAPAQDPLDNLLKSRRVLFIKTNKDSNYSPPLAGEGSGVGSAFSEARLVADLLRRIHRFYGDRFDTDKTVGVIVPYRSQIAAIRAELENLKSQTSNLKSQVSNLKSQVDDLLNISIDTVERFQGSQRDVIIYSFAVTHLYQLDFLTASCYTDEHGHVIDRKLNVALTRARKQMIMVGNPQILRHNALFSQLIQAYS